MNLTAPILRDLSKGQSTADSLAPRIGISTERAEAALRELIDGNLVTSSPLTIGLHDVVTIYRLTEKTRQQLSEK